MDQFIFFCLWLLVTLNFAGYIYALFLMQLMRPRHPHVGLADPDSPNLPTITAVVCVRNESRLILSKLDNLFSQRYPRDKLRCLVVDGGSDDGTVEAVRVHATEHGDWEIQVIEAGPIGKIGQLNTALAEIPNTHVVLVTDADAVIEGTDSLLRTIHILEEEREPVLVGGWCIPPDKADRSLAERMEAIYWDKMNRQRLMETMSYSSSIVVAPFYAFIRSAIPRFPPDCVADDVNISFQFHLRGYRIYYSPDIQVREVRQPKSLSDLVRHKLRKSNAYMMEILRYSYRLPHMRLRVRLLMIFKLFQFFLIPPTSLLFGLYSLYFLANGTIPTLVIGYGLLLLTVGFASVLISFRPSEHGLPNRGVGNPVLSLGVFAITIAVLIVSVFLFPFWRQKATYQRVGG